MTTEIATTLVADGWHAHHDDTFVALLGDIYRREIGGLVQFGLVAGPSTNNISGHVHGGAIVTLLDRVMGANSRAAIGVRAPTATITVNFLSPGKCGDFIVATCDLRRVGRSAVFADAAARVGDKLIATASATFIRPGLETGS